MGFEVALAVWVGMVIAAWDLQDKPKENLSCREYLTALETEYEADGYKIAGSRAFPDGAHAFKFDHEATGSVKLELFLPSTHKENNDADPNFKRAGSCIGQRGDVYIHWHTEAINEGEKA